MKLSKETLDVLKNFASINHSILLRQGSKLKTVTPQKNVMAVATISESIPRELAIYDLNQFLGTVSLFSEPEFEFLEKNVRITDKTGAVANFTYSAKESIVSAPDKDVVLPSTEVTFSLNDKALTSALKAASVMSLPNVAFLGRAGKVYLTALNVNDASDHLWEVPVGETESTFRMIYRLDLLKFLPRDYYVAISSKLITRFVSTSGDVTYFVAAETGSTF